ncbi:MAG: DEAD/DEAH box helicase [Planctomycetota bacterium]|nr:DEAD/DEAH box helicase [Planctomycetota bacterium]MDG2144767.1 DEAD/DEAH box helicase [Planctomycetota bacterium]
MPNKERTEGAPGLQSGGARRAREGREVEDVVAALQADPELRASFRHWRRIPAQDVDVLAFPVGLDGRLVDVLRGQGYEGLYGHQARAIDAALAGRDVLITTPTASGKTLAYTLPVMQKLLETKGRARSLWLFPTKALSQDQSKVFNTRIEELGEDWHSYTYDGDTPPSVRRTLRERGQVILTNPWMLHQGILPNHSKWADLFANLSHVVIDEVHTLSGVFGSNVAGVLRRLRRIANHYGAEPKFLMSSATLRNAQEHGALLAGREVVLIDQDQSPSGERIFGVYNPPMVNPVAGLRKNALEEARRIALTLVGPTHQSIFFCNRRTGVEVLTRYLKECAGRMGIKAEEVRGYRGGYLPDLRREIETDLKEGRVKVVVTTNALELGIDIGSLDVAVLVGYPGSQASFWQRVGRVGRRGSSSLAVMICRSDPVDQYLCAHPEYLFDAPRERLGVDPDNPVILSEQIKCAAFELPFRSEIDAASGDEVVRDFGPSPHVVDILDYFTDESGFLLKSKDTWYFTQDAYPAKDVSLAGNEPDNVLIFDVESGDAIGETDREGSITAVHEGAIYQVEGEIWKIERFDYENRRAYGRKVASDYFTDAHTEVEVRVLRLEERHRRGLVDEHAEDFSIWRGEVHVTTLATLYKKIRFYTRENVGSEDIHLPPEELDTDAFVLTVSNESLARLLEGDDLIADRGSTWHALGSLLKRVAPLFLRCKSADLGVSAQLASGSFKRPALFLFDRHHGGIGLVKLFFDAWDEVFGAALEVLRHCECSHGCPACVGPPEESGPEGKRAVGLLLEHLIEGGRPVATEDLAPEPAGVPEGKPPEALRG